MFYSTTVLTKKGPLAKIWLAAFEARSLKRPDVVASDIPASVEAIIEPEVPIALRTSGHLLLGVVRIHAKKLDFLLADAVDAKLRIQISIPTTSGTSATAAANKLVCKRSAVTMQITDLPAAMAMFRAQTSLRELPAFALQSLQTFTFDATEGVPQGSFNNRSLVQDEPSLSQMDTAVHDSRLSQQDEPWQSAFGGEQIEVDFTGMEDANQSLPEVEALRGNGAAGVDIMMMGEEDRGFGGGDEYHGEPMMMAPANVSATGDLDVSLLSSQHGANTTQGSLSHSILNSSSATVAKGTREKRKRAAAHVDEETEIDSHTLRKLIQDPSSLVLSEGVQREASAKRRKTGADAGTSLLAFLVPQFASVWEKLPIARTVPAHPANVVGQQQAAAVDTTAVDNSALQESVEVLRGDLEEDVPMPASSQMQDKSSTLEPMEYQASQEEQGFGGGDEYYDGGERPLDVATRSFASLSEALNAIPEGDKSDFVRVVDAIDGQLGDQISPNGKKSRRSCAARAFYQMLILDMRGVIETSQERAFAPIEVSRMALVPSEIAA